ncbi:MAG: hypothetical protein F6J93_38290 [Oscillatoria sp. SIO1A7]|nr:hypothetical protein [Oscillatoria sp. SIO1A7]
MFLKEIPKIAKKKLEPIVVGGILLVAASLQFVNGLENMPQVREPEPDSICEEMILPKAELSGEQLAKLLTVPEPSERSKVQKLLSQPYCRLPSLSVRAGAITERDAYPLGFDQGTWLIVLYEGENYVGYGFKRF